MLKYFHNNQIIKQNNIFYIDSCNCGKAKMHNIEAHIAHGQVAHPTKYPWIVRLFFKAPGKVMRKVEFAHLKSDLDLYLDQDT